MGEKRTNGRENELTIDAYVRPAQLLDPIDAKIETLHALESDGAIDDLSLHAWPQKIALSNRTPYGDSIDAFERMQAWADRRGVSIRPPFSVRTRTSAITGETRTVLTTPVLCLAVSVEDRIANVFPHSVDEEHYGVTDAIAALRTGEIDLFTPPPESGATPPDICPECEQRLVNVQGIGVCQECDHVQPGGSPSLRSRRPRDRTELNVNRP